MSQIANNMSQLMVMIIIILMQNLVFLKGQFLVNCCLIYINDLSHAWKFCKVHHFADDTNLLYFSKSVNRLSKAVNLDFKNLTYWLNANKTSLNVKKLRLWFLNTSRKN